MSLVPPHYYRDEYDRERHLADKVIEAARNLVQCEPAKECTFKALRAAVDEYDEHKGNLR